MRPSVRLLALSVLVGVGCTVGDDEAIGDDPGLTPEEEAAEAAEQGDHRAAVTVPAPWAGPYDVSKTVNGITLRVYFNIETAGIHVTSSTAATPTPSATMRRVGATGGVTVTEFVPVVDGSAFHRAATRFKLTPGTCYDAIVTVGTTVITVRGCTQPDRFAFTPARTLYVSATASASGAGTSSNPYRFQAALDAALPGDRILLAPGTYRDPVTVRRSGAANKWIQIRGNGPLGSVVLDGTDPTIQLHELAWRTWTAYPACANVDRSKLWMVSLARQPVLQTGTTFESVLRNGRTFVNYHKPDRLESLQNVTLGMRCQNQSYWYCEPAPEGYYWDASTQTLIVRSATPPSQSTFEVSTGGTALTVDNADWIWIENLTFRNTRGTGAGTEGRGAVLFRGAADHGIVRANRFVHGGNAIKALQTGSGSTYAAPSHLRIEANDISYPGLGGLPYPIVKNNPFRGGAIMLATGRQAIVRDNYIHDASHGIGTGDVAGSYDAGRNLEIDIYRNRLDDLASGRFLIQNQWVNARVFENVARTGFVGFNLLEVRVGPVWVVRNVIHGFDDSTLKPKDRDPLEPHMLFFHNDFIQTALRHDHVCKISPHQVCTSGVNWTPSSTGVCRTYQYLWGAPANFDDADFVHFRFRNNLFYATNFHPLVGETTRLSTLDGGRAFSDNNAFWRAGTLTAFGALADVDGAPYRTLTELRAAFPVEKTSVYANPAFVGLATGYRLQATSPLVNRAVFIPGVNGTKCGAAADIGAIESDCP